LKCILGIDQGGTKTHALISDLQGNLIGFGCSYGACHSTEGMQCAMCAVQEAVRIALEQAEITGKEIVSVAAGMTGVDWADEAELLKQELINTLQLQGVPVTVVNDCMIALRASVSGSSGCILCAGTGLNCGVRDGRGHEYCFGFYIPDEDQGGMALGRRALRAVYDAESGKGSRTLLTQLILEDAGYVSTDALLRAHVTGQLSGNWISGLPILLEEAAIRGDAVAVHILKEFGMNAALYVVAALRRFSMENDPVKVVLSGSVFKCKAPELLDAVRATILKSAPYAEIIESEMEPVTGAVLLAADALYGAASVLFYEHIKRDALRFHMIRKNMKEENGL